MRNTGIHHISVLSSSAKEAYDFYHKILGMKLILNTVNQDDNSMIHLFLEMKAGKLVLNLLYLTWVRNSKLINLVPMQSSEPISF